MYIKHFQTFFLACHFVLNNMQFRCCSCNSHVVHAAVTVALFECGREMILRQRVLALQSVEFSHIVVWYIVTVALACAAIIIRVEELAFYPEAAGF
jgi:predicted RNA-binding Zn-ribbon protein involved in translation (DUF1610 family)